MLEEMIVTLQLPPGSLWSEATLSESLGIGRTPVREALQRLAEYHMVIVLRRHGIGSPRSTSTNSCLCSRHAVSSSA